MFRFLGRAYFFCCTLNIIFYCTWIWSFFIYLLLLLKTNKKSLKLSHDILKKRKIQANITRKNCSRNTVHSRIQSLFQPRYLYHFCLLALFFTTYFFARQNKSTIVYAILRVQTLLFTVFTTLFSVPISSALVWRSFGKNLIQFDLEKITFLASLSLFTTFLFDPNPCYQIKVFRNYLSSLQKQPFWKVFSFVLNNSSIFWNKSVTSNS